MKEANIGQDPGMRAIKEEAARAYERSKQTAISLNLADMRQKLDDAREEQKKFTAQFRNHQTNLLDDLLAPDDKNDTKKDEVLKWKADLLQDPL